MPQEIKKILYATDLGEETRPAFEMALQLAQHHDAKIVVLHTLEALGAIDHLFKSYVSAERAAQFRRDTHNEIKDKIYQRIEQFCAAITGASVKESDYIIDVVVTEEAAEVGILRESKDRHVDLIVMGTRTHSSLVEVMLGSTAHRVMQHSKIPVLVVPL